MLSIVTATEEHIEQLEGNLREADQKELDASNLSLKSSFLLSDYTYALIAGGKPIAVFGYSEDAIGEGAIPWCLGSPECLKYIKELKPLSDYICESLLDKYGLLANAVHESNHIHKRWLVHMGFTLEEDKNINGFIPFHKSRE